MISGALSSLLKPIYLSRVTFGSPQVLFCRNFGTSGPLKNNNAVIFKKNLDVQPYGKLFLESLWLPVHISHTQNLDNRINVCVKGDLSQFSCKGYDFGIKIRKDESDNSIYISNDSEKPVSQPQIPLLSVEIPPYFDVNVNTLEDNGVHFSNLQSPNIVCCTRDGHVRSTSIKCNQFTLLTQNGNAEFDGSLVGNIDVRTGGSGHIRADRLQGTDIRLTSNDGEIRVDAIYANGSSIDCKNADVFLSNVHGCTRVNLEHGDLSIVGLDGTLTATVEQGNIDAQVSRLFQNAGAVLTARNGYITLKLSQELVTYLQLQGKDVLVEEKVEGLKVNVSTDNIITFEGSLNNAAFLHNPVIHAVAPKGTIFIGIQSLFSKVNLTI